MSTTAIRTLAIAAAGAACSLGAAAAVTYSYTGNPFDQPPSSPFIGHSVTATVTFDDSVIGFTGAVGPSSVQSWAIRIAQIPGSEMGSATDAVSDLWPLYFVFDSGAITDWQVLARPVANGSPEIYTTHNSPYSSIVATADFYGANRNSSATLDAPGVWAIPEPTTWLLMLLGLAGLGAARRR